MSPNKTQYRQIEVGEPVYVQDYRKNPKWVKGVVVEKLGPVTYNVQLEHELIWKRHLDQIRRMSFDCEIEENTEKQDSKECLSPSDNTRDKVNYPLPIFGNNDSQLEPTQQTESIPDTTINDQSVSQESSQMSDQNSGNTEGTRRNTVCSTRGIPPKRLINEK